MGNEHGGLTLEATTLPDAGWEDLAEPAQRGRAELLGPDVDAVGP